MRVSVLLLCAVYRVAALPKPTADQLTWLQDEVTAMGSYGMPTYASCGIGAVTFAGRAGNLQKVYNTLPAGKLYNPLDLDTDQWARSLKAAGVKHAVLTVQQACGYTLYPSRTAFPEFNFTYDYGIRQSPYKNGTADVAREFVDSCRKYGIKPGFYTGDMYNAYLNVINGVPGPSTVMPGQVFVTPAQYSKILLANMRQMWTDYGPLGEIWFDGGYPGDMMADIADLLNELQPHAVTFQGPVSGWPNNARWIGTESGLPQYPVWSTSATSLTPGQGSPTAAAFVPAESDTCLQGAPPSAPEGVTFLNKTNPPPYDNCWYYNPYDPPRTVTELAAVYRATVGSNSVVMLGFSPAMDGSIVPSHVERFAQFGEYIAKCYDPVYSVPAASLVPKSSALSVQVSIPDGVQVNKVSIQEDLTNGQAIRLYDLYDGAGVHLGNGSSIGHKRIMTLSHAISGQQVLRLNYTSVGDAGFTAFQLFAPCDPEV